MRASSVIDQDLGMERRDDSLVIYKFPRTIVYSIPPRNQGFLAMIGFLFNLTSINYLRNQDSR